LALAAFIFAPRIALLGSDDPAYRFFTTMLPLLPWVIVFVLAAAVPVINFAILATYSGYALLAFLLQDTINFASLVPGTATTAFALAAVMLASRYEAGVAVVRHEIRSFQWWTNAALACFVTVVVGIVIPVGTSNLYLTRGREAESATRALELYGRAGMWDAFDPQPFLESARVHWSIATGEECAPYRAAITNLDEAIRRDSQHIQLHRMRCQCHVACAELGGESASFEAAVSSAGEVVRLYPTDPASHELLADCLAAKGQFEQDKDALRQAATHYSRALELDDARPSWERIRRLRPRHRAALRNTVDRIEIELEQKSGDGG
jgi:hypothetical protein